STRMRFDISVNILTNHAVNNKKILVFGGKQMRPNIHIDDITDLYVALSGARKPLIAAVDGYAIGVGLQIALCCDYRVGGPDTVMVLPELKLVIACTFGGFMLEATVGRAVMQAMVYSADQWPAERSLADGLIHELAHDGHVLPTATRRGAAVASWTAAAVHGTRPQVNRGFVDGLKRCREAGKVAHRAAFATGDPQERMRRVIGRSGR
ncbi:MAG: enoyl-CoA hydratase-related protein, partial [Solirubrobacteraceae bacterium]